jgi:LuxR family maltose regulon positive regulatory protein
MVQRTGIGQLIQASSAARIILIHGPAGFGKTTVMRQYYESLLNQRTAVSWLRVDAADNDVDRFLAHLAPALQRLDAGNDQNARVPVSLDSVYQVADYEAPFALFIDEFEVLENPVVINLVRQMIEAAPAHGRFVIGSRKIPEIGLGRQRASHQLVEIGPADLRFTLDEADELLRKQRALPLRDEDLGQLQACTEGWPAALHLAALSLAASSDSRGFVAAFSGSNADITDYLAEDILSKQPEDIRQFLLKTSILNELSGPLCNTLLGITDSARILERLERANLFILPLDANRVCYRYHSLFKEFLRTQLQRSHFDEIDALHLAASIWYEENGRPVPAIEHAVVTNNTDRILDLLTKHARPLLAQGRFSMLAPWFATLPVKTLQLHPQLCISYAWVLASIHQPGKAKAMLLDLGRPAVSDCLDGPSKANIRTLSSLAHVMLDDLAACFESSGKAWPVTPEEEPAAYGVNALFHALCLASLNRFDDAIYMLDCARRSHASAGHALGLAMAERMHSVIEMSRGRLSHAVKRLRRAFEDLAKEGSSPVGLGGTVAVMLATALYECNELVEAERLLREYLTVSNEAATPDVVICSHVALARITAFRGDRERALEVLSTLEQLGHQWSLPRLVASAWLERANIAMLAGQFDTARAYIQYADNHQIWLPFKNFTMYANDLESPAIVKLRLLIRTGEAAKALPELKKQLREAEDAGRYRRALKLKILLAEALEITNQGNLARRTLTEALRFAAAEGFVRTFAEEGPVVSRLLLEFHGAASEQGSEAAVPLAFVNRILEATGHKTAPAPEEEFEDISSQESQAKIRAGITKREVRVLQLLAKGYTNTQIAEQLFVAHATINAHLRNINQKLDVHNRTQAVAKARELRIVP